MSLPFQTLDVFFEDILIISQSIRLKRKMVSAMPSLALRKMKYGALPLLKGKLPSGHSGMKNQKGLSSLPPTKNGQLYSKNNYS